MNPFFSSSVELFIKKDEKRSMSGCSSRRKWTDTQTDRHTMVVKMGGAEEEERVETGGRGREWTFGF